MHASEPSENQTGDQNLPVSAHSGMGSGMDTGMATAAELAGEEGVRDFCENLDPISRDAAELAIGFVFGTLHDRPGLTHREREMIALVALAALGGTETQLLWHLNIAHRLGVPPAFVVELFIHVSAYAGFPRALNAIDTAKRFYAEKGLLPLST